ncbi:hypothetical protein, partial [Mesorhizobium sp. M7A.F.Ca.US.005.03.2.1]|uniref:hypothetical protein n=1 Tax=Mesorhizobium sp. M7A.F.Ca.US.005.03.2.1 TaxID=2496737 RepID=UPI0019D2197C
RGYPKTFPPIGAPIYTAKRRECKQQAFTSGTCGSRPASAFKERNCRAMSRTEAAANAAGHPKG